MSDELLSPEVEACANETTERMFESGEIGILIDSGYTHDEIINMIVEECKKNVEPVGSILHISPDRNTVTVGDTVYIKRSHAVILGVGGFLFGGLVSGAIGFLVGNAIGSVASGTLAYLASNEDE